ncbi:MAG: flagellar motor protein MotB [Nitrospirales bacterium]
MLVHYSRATAMAKKQHEGYENHACWLLFHADFMTLLFAFLS